MQTRSPFFDDIANILTGAAGAARGMREEVDVLIRAQVEKAANELDLVPREEFEAVRAMAIKAMDRVDALESELAALKGSAKPKAAAGKSAAKATQKVTKKSAAKKTAANRKD